MSDNNPRKSPYRVRRQSVSEFGRVTAMLHSDDEAQNTRLDALEAEIKSLKNQLKRKKTATPETEPDE